MLLEQEIMKRNQYMSKKQVREERKQRNISSKRQVTIPQSFFDELGFEEKVEFVKRGNELILRPVREPIDFSEEILKDLLSQGITGDNLLSEFIAVKKKLRSAAERMLDDAELLAKKQTGTGNKETEEIFGDID